MNTQRLVRRVFVSVAVLCSVLLLQACGTTSAGVPTKILVAATQFFAGHCASVTVSATDAAGTAVAAPAAVTVNLTGKGSGSFFSDAACATPITSYDIAVGATSATVYYKNNSAEVLTLTASDAAGTLTLGTLAVTVTAKWARLVPSAAVSNSDHHCALTDGGSAYCWGANRLGELGDGTTGDATRPTPVRTADIVDFGAGDKHSCVATPAGTVRCWGNNEFGQLGQPAVAHRGLDVVTVGGITSGATRVSGGAAFTCAIVSGVTKCWGVNGNRELGNNLMADTEVPQTVVSLSATATQVASGEGHSCALVDGGTVKCWGQNNYGQVGDNSTNPGNVAKATGITTATKIAVGGFSSCAILSDKSVKCWGYVASESPIPATVTDVANAIDISVGWNHACALLEDGSAKCWGYNYLGQLGAATVADYQAAGVAVEALGGTAVSLSTGVENTCALLSDNTIKCWGGSLSHGLGRPTVFRAAAPTTIPGASLPAIGGSGMCSVVGNGVKCWGANYNGQLGNNTRTGSLSLTSVSGISSSDISLAYGGNHVCARLGGAVKCWGQNAGNGQTGLGSNVADTLVPGADTIGANVTQIAAGYNHSCALFANGSVQCWGNDDNGQLGNNSTGNTYVPGTIVNGPVNPLALAAGGSSTCLLHSDNTVGCFGEINGDQQTEQPISGVTGATKIAVGGGHACAIVGGGAVKCWGLNDSGQLGNNSTTNSAAAVSAQLHGGATAVDIVAGNFHTCILTNSGGVQCWGTNVNGQLGIWTVTEHAQVAEPVTDLGGTVTAISGHHNNTCAVVTGVGTRCWGSNSDGQLALTGSPAFNPPTATLPALRDAPASLVIDAARSRNSGCKPINVSLVTVTGALASWLAANKTVNLHGISSDGGEYFSEQNCNTTTTTAVIPAGAHSVTVYYKSTSDAELVVHSVSDADGVLATSPKVYSQWGIL